MKAVASTAHATAVEKNDPIKAFRAEWARRRLRNIAAVAPANSA